MNIYRNYGAMPEGCRLIESEWIATGWTKNKGSYFILRLPSYQWEKDFQRQVFCWHQLAIAWFHRDGFTFGMLSNYE